MWAKIDEFLVCDPLKIIWDPPKNSIVSEIALYQGVLYQGCSVLCSSTAKVQNDRLDRNESRFDLQVFIGAQKSGPLDLFVKYTLP